MNQAPRARANHLTLASLTFSNIAQAKVEIRAALLKKLQSRTLADRRQVAEGRIARELGLFLSNNPGVWLSYRSFQAEVHLSLETNSRAVTLAYPMVDQANNQLQFYRSRSQSSGKFKASTFGIESPDLNDDTWMVVEPGFDNEVIGAFVPAIAFDRRGVRLGRGRGYYDRFLSETEKLRRSNGLKSLFKIGIGFHEQVVEELPCETHDVKLDAVLTDREWITPVKGEEYE